MTAQTMYWRSSDAQGNIDGGTIAAGADVEAEKASFLSDLLSYCVTDEERDGILAGEIVVLEAA